MSSAMIVAAITAVAPAPGVAAPHIVTYPAAFYAPSQPTTALDMIQVTPGFVFDAGAGARGFVGAAGNVLVDGARPASKDDTLDDPDLLPPPEEVAAEIVENLETALERFRRVANALNRS